MQRIHYSIPCIILLLLTSVFLNAQDQPLRERFIWLPAGDYSTINYVDPSALKAGDGWQVYSETLGAFGIRSLITAPIPLGDLEDLQYCIKARLFKGKATPRPFKEGEDPMQMQPPKGDVIGGKIVGNRNYFVHGISHRLEIYGFLDGALAVQRGMEAGYLEPDGNELAGSPAYVITPRSSQFRKDTEPLAAWMSPTGELLIAESIELLEQMVKAGIGESPSLVEDQFYIEIFEAAENFGQEWSMRNSMVMKTLLLEGLVKHGEERAEIDKVEKWLDDGSDWGIDTIDASDGLGTAQKVFLPTPQSAENYADTARQRIDGSSINMTRDGNIVTTREKFSEEKIEQFKQQVEKWRQRIEEQRKKAAEGGS